MNFTINVASLESLLQGYAASPALVRTRELERQALFSQSYVAILYMCLIPLLLVSIASAAVAWFSTSLWSWGVPLMSLLGGVLAYRFMTKVKNAYVAAVYTYNTLAPLDDKDFLDSEMFRKGMQVLKNKSYYCPDEPLTVAHQLLLIYFCNEGDPDSPDSNASAEQDIPFTTTVPLK